MPDDPAEPFYAAIRAVPDDDLPRLVFADWLDENGQPERAEYIRLTCAIARESDGAGKRAWQARADELFRTFRLEWFGSIPELLNGGVGDVTFDRGFVTRTRVSAAVLTTHADQFDRFTPVLRHACISTVGETAGAVLWSESIRRLRSLSLAGVTSGSLNDLTAHTELSDLSDLNVGITGCATAVEAARFLRWSLVQTPPSLSLSVRFESGERHTENPFSTNDEQTARLIPRIGLANLKGLTFDRVSGLTGDALAGWSGLSRLATLVFASARSEVTSFLHSPKLSSLQFLVFYNCQMGDDAVSAIAACPQLSKLKTLGLSSSRLTDRSVYTLVSSPHLPSSLQLIVGSNPFSSHAAARLRERFPNVRF